MLKYLPDLTRPKNEVYTLLVVAIALGNVVVDWLSDQDLSSDSGILAAVLGVSALVGRMRTVGAETAARLSGKPVDQVLEA